MLLIGLLIASIVIVVVAISYFLRIVTVHGDSMRPTLTEGDQVLLIRRWPLQWLRKGQVVVIRAPIASRQVNVGKGKCILLIKRITALPGETILTAVEELPIAERIRQKNFFNSAGIRTWMIPLGHFFLEGDSFGMDSRILGPLSLDTLIGVVVMKLQRS